MLYINIEHQQPWCHAEVSAVPTNAIVPHAAINEVRTRGESCGGEVTCVVRNVPKGLGSPVFDKLEAELAKAMLSLPATKVRGRGCLPTDIHRRGSKVGEAAGKT
jgi:chorismate synthase